MSTQTVNVHDVLVKARDHIAAVGLYKGGFFADESDYDSTPCCSMGALHWATGISDLWRDARRALVAQLDTANVSTFNDRPETTLEDVLAVFDKAIEAATP
jgi:hypothetical protein